MGMAFSEKFNAVAIFAARGVKRSIEWLIKRLIKVGAKVAHHGRMWHVHVAAAFPLAGHYRAAFGSGTPGGSWLTRGRMEKYAQKPETTPYFGKMVSIAISEGSVERTRRTLGSEDRSNGRSTAQVSQDGERSA
jgi:hypothetical protein